MVAQHHNQHDQRALRQDSWLAPGQIAPVLEGLGDIHHAVTTSSERAELFLDQGRALTYGFNHQEALRPFKEAARLDPDRAMAHRGWALVLGPRDVETAEIEARYQTAGSHADRALTTSRS